VSQRDNAVAEPSGSASDYDAGERDAGERASGELSGASLAGSPANGPDDASAAGPGPGAGDDAGVPGPADAGPGPAASQAGDAAAELDGGTLVGDADAGPDDDADAGPDDDADLADDGGAEDGGSDEAGGRAEGAGDVADLELEGEIAADYVEGLLDVADLDGDIDMDVEGDRALVSVVGATLDELVGPRGEVLEALQELTRLAVHRQTGVRTRIMLDVGGYRLRRRAELAEAGREVAEEVRQTGTSKKMWAMNRFERKIVHDAVAAAGLRSESEGEEPDRKVVVLPAD
jgi:spoIIIJ-associated protein